MTARSMPETSSDAADPSWWGAILVGAIFIFAGLFVLGDVVAATVISAFLIGVLLVVAGAAEVFQAFSAQHWRGFLVRMLIGLLYAVCGLMLISDPARGSVILTLVFALSLIASGFVRIFQAIQYWEWFGIATACLRHRGHRCRACHSCKVAGQRLVGSGSSSRYRSHASRSLVDLARAAVCAGNEAPYRTDGRRWRLD